MRGRRKPRKRMRESRISKVAEGMILIDPPNGSWLKKGEKIKVKEGGRIFQLTHNAPKGKTEMASIIAEVREYLLIGNVAANYSTRIWFGDTPCDIKVEISQRKEIQAYYKKGEAIDKTKVVEDSWTEFLQNFLFFK